MLSAQERPWRTSQQERGAVGSELALHKQRSTHKLRVPTAWHLMRQVCRCQDDALSTLTHAQEHHRAAV